MNPQSKPKSVPLGAKSTNMKTSGLPAKTGGLPLIDDPHRHPGMPPVDNDRPIDIRDQCNYLTKVAEIVVPQAEASKEELVDCEKLRRKLLQICIQVVEKAAEHMLEPAADLETSLLCFGSLRSGIALRGSDMDLLLKVTSAEGTDLITKLGLLRRLQKALLLQGYGARLLTTARIPILKVCTQPPEDLLNALWRELREWEARHHGLGNSPLTDAQRIQLFQAAINDGWYNDADKKIIKHFEDAIQKSNGNAQDPAVSSARAMLKKLPRVLERYTGLRTMHDLEFPAQGIGIQCDINFSGELARHNSQLVRCYMRCDERLRQMVVFVKAWAKSREINSSYNGTLCSYGYVLMILHFAVNIANPPLCPNLQHQLSVMRGGADGVPRQCEGYNVQFWRNEKQVELAASRGMLTYNQQSIGSLLRGFFAYYANAQRDFKAFNWSEDVLSLRSTNGLLSKRVKGWTVAHTQIVPGFTPDQPHREVRHRYLLAIEDPFEVDHNVARTVTHFGMCAVRDEFRRAHRLIQHGGLMGDMAIDLMERSDPKELVYPGLGPSDRLLDHKDEVSTKDSSKAPAKPVVETTANNPVKAPPTESLKPHARLPAMPAPKEPPKRPAKKSGKDKKAGEIPVVKKKVITTAAEENGTW